MPKPYGSGRSRRAVIGIAGMAAATLLPHVALAQSAPGPAGDGQAGRFIARMPGNTMRLSKIVGTNVIGSDIHKIGDIDDVLMDSQGQVAAVVVGVGGFLGLGEKLVALPFGEFLWNTGASPTSGPSASVAPENAPSPAAAASAGAERMPGANVSDQVLSVTQDNQSGRVDPATGPVATAGTASATVTVVGKSGGPVEAVLRKTKAELQDAPGFRYDAEGAAVAPKR